jgi:hypothetical protein
MQDLHIHIHQPSSPSEGAGWQRVAVIVAGGMLILQGLPYLGVSPSQPPSSPPPRPRQVEIVVPSPPAAAPTKCLSVKVAPRRVVYRAPREKR